VVATPFGGVDVEQSLGDRRVEHQAQWRHRVPDRAVAEPTIAARAGRQPVNEVLDCGAVQFADTDLAVK
jgi:hypothetical protein